MLFIKQFKHLNVMDGLTLSHTVHFEHLHGTHTEQKDFKRLYAIWNEICTEFEAISVAWHCFPLYNCYFLAKVVKRFEKLIAWDWSLCGVRSAAVNGVQWVAYIDRRQLVADTATDCSLSSAP